MRGEFHSLLSNIESISDRIPENVYIKICDDLKSIYRKLETKQLTKCETGSTVAPAQNVANGYWLRQTERRVEPVYKFQNEDFARRMGLDGG